MRVPAIVQLHHHLLMPCASKYLLGKCNFLENYGNLKFSAVFGQMSEKSSIIIRPISVEPTFISKKEKKHVEEILTFFDARVQIFQKAQLSPMQSSPARNGPPTPPPPGPAKLS